MTIAEGPVSAPLLSGVNPTAMLVLSLAGTFVFGLSGGLAGVRARLDAFGIIVLAAVVGMAGGTIRDVLIGRPPATFRDWRYLAVLAAAGVVTLVAFRALERIHRSIQVLDAAGLALTCVTGASIALQYRLEAPQAVILGAISGIGGGMLRDLIVGEVPQVLRGGLYAVPALLGAGIAVAAFRLGEHGFAFSLLGAGACFALRVAAIRYDLSLPALPYLARDESEGGPGG